MNVKILKIFLTVFVVILFSGCTKEIVYVDRPVTVKVPVKCKVPDVRCDFNKNTYTEIINALLQCVYEQNEAAKVCK